MSIRAIAVGTPLVVGCVSLVMLLLMRHVLSILVPSLVPTRWKISLFFSFLTHLLLLLLCLLQDLLPLMYLLQHRPPLLRLVLLVLLVLRSLPLLFLILHRRLLRRLPLMAGRLSRTNGFSRRKQMLMVMLLSIKLDLSQKGFDKFKELTTMRLSHQ